MATAARKAYVKRWQEVNKEQVTAERLRKRLKLRQRVLDMFGGVCLWCGEDHALVLDLDHIHGNGYQDRKTRSSNQLYAAVARGDEDPAKFRLLCRNCNWIAWAQRRKDPRVTF